MENHDEQFISIGSYEGNENNGERPLHLFLHVLHNEKFDSALIPNIYNVLIQENMIQDPKTICMIITIHPTLRQTTIIHHENEKHREFMKKTIYRLFTDCMYMKRVLPYTMAINYNGTYFSVKYFDTISIERPLIKPIEKEYETILGPTVYYYTKKEFPHIQ